LAGQEKKALAGNLIMNIIIDGQTVKVIRSDKNLIDVADRAQVAIPCACYRSRKAKGCCRACVVMVDGRKRFACTTVPEDGMNVTVTRKDLITLRKKRLSEYRDQIRRAASNACCPATGKCCC